MAKNKKKFQNIDAQQALTFWTSPVQKAAPALGMEPEIKEKPAKEKPPFQRKAIAPEDALEQFIGSVCFVEYLFKAHDMDMHFELHPYRLVTGWCWTCGAEPVQGLSYITTPLALPRLSEDIYKAIWRQYISFEDKYGSRERVYVEIGNNFKGDQNFAPHAEQMRAQLALYIVEEKSA